MILVLSTVALLSLGVGVSRAAAAQGASPSTKLQVWNLNTKNMGNHPGFDYTEFVAYITDPARSLYYPDIVTLQEVGRPDVPNDDCTILVLKLETTTGLDYRCFQTTLKGGSGIAYRTSRLSFKSDLTFRLKTYAGCQPDDNPGDWWAALALRLKDDVNGKYVNVASFHLNTPQYHSCVWDNMKLTDEKINGLGSAQMRIMAGDLNNEAATVDPNSFAFSFWECWYNGTNVDRTDCGNQNLGWKDPMYRLCSQSNSSASSIFNCLRADHWTFRGDKPPLERKRFDFLFVKAYAIGNQVTASYEDADVSAGESPPDGELYSDHRGQGALLTYY